MPVNLIVLRFSFTIHEAFCVSRLYVAQLLHTRVELGGAQTYALLLYNSPSVIH